MAAKSNTAPTALGGANNSPDKPASNLAGQDFAMPRTPRHSRETRPGPRPGGGNPEPPTQAPEKLSEMTRTPRHTRAPSVIPAKAGIQAPKPPAPALDPRFRGSDAQPADDRAHAREIVFVDPGVSDIETIVGHLRPEVEAVLLDPVRPAAHQIEAAVASRHGLDAVHIIAHGAPGRVSFAAGDWSAATLEEEAEDFAAIGQALGAGRNVNLWSCRTAAGPAGAAFIAGLARASGADIAAATGRVGAAALGGGWELATTAQPPLTAAGRVNYTGVLAAFEITVTGTLPTGNTTGTVTHFIIDKATGTIVSQIILPDAAKQFNSVAIAVKVPSATASYAVGTFDSNGDFQPSSFLSVSSPAGHQRPSGAVGPSGR
jgi:hypothetical protein